MDTTLHIKALDLDESALESLQGLADDENARWYYERRRRALVATGVLAAGSWDPLMHPRGRDGRFIDKFGFVRWLVDGSWKRGQVTDILSNGDIQVRGADGDPHTFTNFTARKQLYSLPKPKAKLELPDPKADVSVPNFVKIGGQGGSNPGALYKISEVPDGKLAYSASIAKDAWAFAAQQDDGAKYKLTPMDFDMSEDSSSIASTFEKQGFILDRSRDRVYSVVDGKVRELGGETVTLDDVFGKPGSAERHGRIGEVDMIDRLDWKDVGELSAMMRHMVEGLPQEGDQFYVKTTKSEDHAKNEVLASTLYELGGVPVPDVAVGMDDLANGVRTVSSKMVNVDSAETLTGTDILVDPEILSRIREDMVFDAWLANWDVAGLHYDNIIVVEGVPFRVDVGGALSYRAQGGNKGAKFGTQVGELQTLKNPSMNAQAAKVFGAITPGELKAGAERLAAISVVDIDRAVADAGLDQSMADKLIARRADILNQVGVDVPLHKLPIIIPNSDGIDLILGDDGELSYVGEITTKPVSGGKKLNVLVNGKWNGTTLEAGTLKHLAGPYLTDEQRAAITPKTPESTFPYPLDLTGKVWHPGTKNFVDGEVKAWWAASLSGVADATKKSFTIMGIDDLLTRQMDGEPNYEFGTDNHLYSIDVDYVDNFEASSKYKLTYTHAVTGKKYEREVTGGIYEINTDPATLDAFRAAYNHQMMWTIDAHDRTSQGALSYGAATSDGNLATTPFSDIKNLEHGEWFLDTATGEGPLYGTFYRFDDVVPNHSPQAGSTNVVVVSTLDGETKTIELPLSPLRYRRPTTGSFLSQVLDSSRARTEVSKHNDHSWGLDTPVTDGDKKMQSAVAAKLHGDTGDYLGSGVPSVDVDLSDGLNESISITGEPIKVAELQYDEAKKLIGKTIYMQLVDEAKVKYDYTTQSWSYHPPRARGVYIVTDVKGGPTASGVSTVSLTLTNSVGSVRSAGKYGDKIEIVEVSTQLAPITQFQVKTNNTLVVNGEVVGSWKKSNGNYDVHIDAKYSVTGQPFYQKVRRKDGIKQVSVSMIVPPGSAKARPKSDKSKALEKKIREADIKFSEPHQTTAGGEAVTLLDGAEIKDGMWVISKTDGHVGQVSGVSTAYLGYVNVKTPDGKVKIRAAKTLSAASDPSGTVFPPPSPLYADVKLSDGSQAFPSEKVLDGASELVLLQLKPDGSVRVGHPDGKKTWMKASKLAPAQPAVTEPEDTAVVIAALDDGWKTAPKAKKIPYAAPGGVTIPQQPDAVETYRRFAVTRKLTRDNFVPQVGMKVRDTKGKQLTIVRIAHTASGNPSAVWVFNPDTYSVSVRQPSVLWVDHAAELSTPTGKPLPKVGAIFFQKNDSTESLPSGTTIYSADTTAYLNGRSQKIKAYYAALPDGSVLKFRADTSANIAYNQDIHNAISIGNFTKVAYVDETSSSTMTIESHDSWGASISAVYIHENEPGALESLKSQIADEQIKLGVVEDETFPGTQKQLIRLPKPTDASDMHVSALKPPAATGDASVLKGPPAVAQSLSIDTGIHRLLEQRNSDKPGQSVVYAIGDSDYIEDMAIRLHMAVDETNNEEMIEVRFGLLEHQADHLASRLITNDGAILGDWTWAENKMPNDLIDGDKISVRIGSTGALKPGHDSNPNATVVGTPQHVGTSKSGLDAYRVNVAMASGAVGHVILEMRSTPSIQTFEWDPTKSQHSNYFNGSVNGDAVSMGWKVRNMNAVAYEANGKIEIDAKGRKLIKKDTDGIKSIASYAGAARMQYEHPGGGFMTVQVVHPDAESRTKGIDLNTAIRSTVNGEVVIRVNANDPDALQKISDMMAAAGVPPEKQGQPSADDLTKMALNKVHKQFAAKYEHMDQANVNGSNDAAGVARVLSDIDGAVGTALGRPATLDDVRLRVMPDGRVAVVLSDDVADAVVKSSTFTNAYHSFTGGYKPEFFSSGASLGLLSTDERWSMGILTSGMSSGSDVTNDAGNRVYLRFSNRQPSSKLTSSGQAVISARALAKTTDWYWGPGDPWGKRKSSNRAWKTGEFSHGGQEVVMKRKIDPELIGFVTFGSDSARDSAIKELNNRGVTMIGDRPVEEVFVTSGEMSVSDLASLGEHVGTEIPLTGLVSM